jgi:hypothetical protein
VAGDRRNQIIAATGFLQDASSRYAQAMPAVIVGSD